MSRRHSSAPEPSLFPFLNVLAAVIGTLILVISGMSMLSIANPDQLVELEPRGASQKKPVANPDENAERSARGTAPKKPGVNSDDRMVELGPHGTTEKTPVYVECQRDQLVIYTDDVGTADAGEPQRVPIEKFLWDDSPWVRLLEQIRVQQASKYIILLVRPDAIESFQKAYGSVDRKLVDVGFDPIYETGKVKFKKSRTETAP
jgi:hypothetical protein